ncbi:MAG: ABC transporter substrate-binding protein [Alphaproteobacteria bacterium]|nr:ABC transporter substrate-binding protein [Alphaproteobacteria bacterium]
MRFFITLILITTTLLLSACSKDDDSAKRDDVVIGLALEPDHLDPTAGAAGAIDEVTYHNIFEGLTRINHNAEIVPMLATKWQISENATIYDFTLKQNVTFHNGETFTADDVLFSLNRARGGNSVNAQKILFDNIKTIEKISDFQIRIILNQSDSDFAYKMAWGDAVMIDESSADNNKQHPIGTGAFVFDSWQKGQKITLKRNPDYHGNAPALAQVIFMFLSDTTAAFNAISTQVIDGFPNFRAAEQLERLSKNENLTITIGSTEGETILAINHAKPLMNDINVRRAIAHAINKQAIIDGAMFGYATAISSHMPSHHPFYQDLSHITPFDISIAKQYLAKSIYQGETLQIDLPPSGYSRRSGEIIAAQLRAIGIAVELNNMEWSGWLKDVFRGKNYDLTIIAHTEPNDMNIYARNDYYFSYHNDEFNQIIADMQYATDEATLKNLSQRAQQILAETVAAGFLFQLPKLGVWHKNLQGYWANSPIQAADVTDISWQ